MENHADVPREFGKNLCACIPCRLVKTFDQVGHYLTLVFFLSCLKLPGFPHAAMQDTRALVGGVHTLGVWFVLHPPCQELAAVMNAPVCGGRLRKLSVPSDGQ